MAFATARSVSLHGALGHLVDVAALDARVGRHINAVSPDL